VTERVLHREIRRRHVVVTHRDEDFQKRIFRERVAERGTRVDVVVIRAPVSWSNATAENVILEIALVAEFRTDIVIER